MFVNFYSECIKRMSFRALFLFTRVKQESLPLEDCIAAIFKILPLI